MNPYRFSTSDRAALQTLLDGFCSVFSFTVGRQPSVYYDTVARFSVRFSHMAGAESLINQESPDYFGFYYVERPIQPNQPTEPGIIILFKDRIENAFNMLNVGYGDLDKLKNILLLQCMADFIIHWACKSNIRWRYGFSYPMPKIRAGLSRLITHACCTDESDFEYLQYLTPVRDTKNWNLQFQKGFESVDTAKAGGFYIQLLGMNREIILNKVTELRKAFWLNEEYMIEFLLSEHSNIKTYLEFKIQQNPTTKAASIFFPEDCLDIHKFKDKDLASFHKLYKAWNVMGRFGLGTPSESFFFLNEEKDNCLFF
jgi:hypothetical protein